jgi:hypothetical protein
MRHIAIIGSGPAGYYTAEAAQKKFGDDVRVDIIDRLPVPFGLIRFGVAPDHQSIKAVSNRYEKVALSDNVRFVGNVSVGKDISIDELNGLYDAVVLATGAPNDRKLDIPGGDLPGVMGSAAFVGWYNGHPDFADLAPPLDGTHVVVIGNGNVALDVARILSKTRLEFGGSDIVSHALDALEQAHTEEVTILGRRGPHQIAMTPKELGELGHLERATPRVEKADSLRTSMRKRRLTSTLISLQLLSLLMVMGKLSVSLLNARRWMSRCVVSALAKPIRSIVRWLSAASDIRRHLSRVCLTNMGVADLQAMKGGYYRASIASAGRGGGLQEPSVPTGLMVMQ